MEKIRDLTCLSDILPTGFHGAVTAKVSVGSTVYVAGAGPVGLAAAASARILGAAAVLIGDMNKERLAHARSVGFEPIDLSRHDRLGELVADVLGVPEVDCAIDCVGFEAKAQGTDGKVVEAPAVVLNGLMEITRAAGAIGIPGLYVTDDPGAKEQAAKNGNLSLHTGQTPVLKYNRQLMQAILWDRLPIAKIVNVKVIDLEQAPEGYRSFDAGVASKFVIDPHKQLARAA
jgi:glutathione-independent formaldehyde dehydrogenase